MEKITLSRAEARRFVLTHQGLLPPGRLKNKSGVLEHVRRVGCIQFDPLNIVGHNQELVLQARVSDFRPPMLQELLYRERKLLDGWDKMMSIYGVQNWPYFHRRRQAARRYYGKPSRAAMAILPQVRKAIEERGPLSSIDLEFNQKVDWSWAPTRLARAALESMYFWGELVIHSRVHTRKVYDLAQRHLPAALLSAADPNKTEEQFYDWYLLRRIGGVGLLWNKAGDAWGGMGRIKSGQRGVTLARLLKAGKVIEVEVEGLESPLYMREGDKGHLNSHPGARSPGAAVLAPLDNLLWDRRLVEDLFDFCYRWEVYKPVAQRQYGYYVLPLLYGDRFIARFEPGWDKQRRALIIKQWWWEPGVKQSQRMHAALIACFKRFLRYLDTADLEITGEAQEQAGLAWLTRRGSEAGI